MKVCDYCHKDIDGCTGADIYPHRPDLAHKLFFRCVPCGAYVGRHAGSGIALGRLANSELRAAKMRAHAAFDPLWKVGDYQTRNDAYAWLAREMRIPKEKCHIGMFDLEQCAQVESICNTVTTKAQAPGGKNP